MSQRRQVSMIMVALVLAALATPAVFPQILPDIPRKPGEVQTRRPAPKIFRAVRPTPRRPRVATNGKLIVMTIPDNAEVIIDNVSKGKADNGQFDIDLPAGDYKVKVAAGLNYKPEEKTVKLKAGDSKVEQFGLDSTYGVVTLAPIIKDAQLYIDGQLASPDRYKVDTPGKKITIRLLGRPEKKYKLAYAHPDWVVYEQEFNVLGGDEQDWIIFPERAETDLTVTTEPGTDVYLDTERESRGRTTASGTLPIRSLRVGKHKVRLVNENFKGYEGEITLELGKRGSLEVKLERKPISDPLDEYFNSDSQWHAPRDWKFKGRLTVADSPTLGYVKDHYYEDFTMDFNLRLDNGAGAAWALRVKDPKNYYLFYLSGSKGKPYSFSMFVVRDGVAQPHGTALPVAKLEEGGFYKVSIEVKGETIEHWMTPATGPDRGQKSKFGRHPAPRPGFAGGSVGFRTVGAEQFTVDDLFISPIKK